MWGQMAAAYLNGNVGSSPVARVDTTVQSSAEEFRLREQVRQLQGLLQRQKELTEQARAERDAMRDRLMQIFIIADS